MTRVPGIPSPFTAEHMRARQQAEFERQFDLHAAEFRARMNALADAYNLQQSQPGADAPSPGADAPRQQESST